jgi:hypothetical protein
MISTTMPSSQPLRSAGITSPVPCRNARPVPGSTAPFLRRTELGECITRKHQQLPGERRVVTRGRALASGTNDLAPCAPTESGAFGMTGRFHYPNALAFRGGRLMERYHARAITTASRHKRPSGARTSASAFREVAWDDSSGDSRSTSGGKDFAHARAGNSHWAV